MTRDRALSGMYSIAMMSPVQATPIVIEMEDDAPDDAPGDTPGHMDTTHPGKQRAASGEMNSVASLRRLLSRGGTRGATTHATTTTTTTTTDTEEDLQATWSNSSENASLSASSVPNTPAPPEPASLPPSPPLPHHKAPLFLTDLATHLTPFLTLREHYTLLSTNKTLFSAFDVQALWKIHFERLGGVDENIRDYRVRCRLLCCVSRTPTAKGCTELQTRLCEEYATSPEEGAVQVDELLEGLNAIDSSSKGLEEWAKAHPAKRQESEEGAEARVALYRKELKRSCEATPLQRMCDHSHLEVVRTLDPSCKEVTCSRCAVTAVMRIRRGVAVLAGIDLGPLHARRNGKSAQLSGTMVARPTAAFSPDASAPKPHSANITTNPLPPLARRKFHATR